MKTKLLIIITLSVTLGMSFAYAVPALDYHQAFEYSDFVIVGKIVFVDIISEKPGVAMYEIEILEFKKSPEPIKNPVDSEFIIVPGTFLREPHAMSYNTYPYEVGQIGTFYIQKNHIDSIDSELIIRSGVSRVNSEPVPNIPIPENCGPNTFLKDDVCEATYPGCNPDAYGNYYCDPPVEDGLTLERFLFESPPIALLVVFGILGLIIGIPIVVIYVWRKRK